MLVKTPVSINFTQGVSTKVDPYQLPIGNFLNLKNSVFDKQGRLTKRNGFDNITNLPNDTQTTLTTLNNNLLATGSNLYAFNPTTNGWTNQGLIQPVQIEVKSLVRNSYAQSNVDSIVTDNNLCCTVYIQNSLAYYQMFDSTTGQQVIAQTALPATSTNPRVFILGRYIIITFLATVSAASHLQYISIPISNPSNPAAAVDINTSTTGLTAGYDGVVINNSLYTAVAGSGTTIKIRYLTSTLGQSSTVSIAAHTATLMSVSADTASTPIIWVTFWDSGSNNGYTAAFNQILSPVLATTQIISSVVINSITSLPSDGVLTVLYETQNTYSFSSVKTDYLSKLTITTAGTIVGPSVILRSTGLASKLFFDETTGKNYVLATYGEINQPTYLLIDDSGNIYMRLAYSNGGGYITNQVLPSVSLVDTTYQVCYLIKDFLATVNKGTSLATGTPVNAIYTQTGVNLAQFTINNSIQYSSEIANALHLTGGQLWEYDSIKPVEHGFHVWPENMLASTSSTTGSMTSQIYFYTFTYEWTDNQGNLHRSAPSIPLQEEVLAGPGTVTGNRTSGSAVISSIASTTGLQKGQAVSGTGIPASTFILSVDSGTQITLTHNASSGSATSTVLTITAATSVTINVPTLRLTYKIAPNPVRIVGYRWSTAQQVYYQFTSIASPTINDTTVDSVSISDTNSDAQILGQTLLYTTGGVVENIAAPASIDSALYKNRLFLIDAEDRNLLWYSKQVIENVPVEMSDLFTVFIAPTSGAQGSTGDMTAVSAMDDKLVIFKKDAIYYITGNGPDNTGSNNDFSDPVFITSSVGCDNPNSIILMPMGLMFQSDKGIWLLGRDLSTKYIGDRVEAFNSQTVENANVIPGTNQVRFVMGNNITLMYDYFYDQWGTFDNIKAISATLYQGLHTYLNADGKVYQELSGSYIDGSKPVLMSFTTSWVNIAGLQGFERFYFGNLLGTYYSPFKLNMQIAYDYLQSAQQQIVITPDNNTPNWGGEAVWGSGQPWGGPGNVLSSRFFPNKQKCQSFQITMNEVYDSSLGVAPGQGLSLSGLALIVGVKRGFRTQKASRSFG